MAMRRIAKPFSIEQLPENRKKGHFTLASKLFICYINRWYKNYIYIPGDRVPAAGSRPGRGRFCAGTQGARPEALPPKMQGGYILCEIMRV